VGRVVQGKWGKENMLTVPPRLPRLSRERPPGSYSRRPPGKWPTLLPCPPLLPLRLTSLSLALTRENERVLRSLP